MKTISPDFVLSFFEIGDPKSLFFISKFAGEGFDKIVWNDFEWVNLFKGHLNI